jgi:hypothetical protein
MAEPLKCPPGGSHKVENWQSKFPTLKERLAYAVSNEEFSDIVFLVGSNKEPIRCNKFMLSVSSPVFEAMFSGRWELRETEILIPDAEPGPFRYFLKVESSAHGHFSKWAGPTF